MAVLPVVVTAMPPYAAVIGWDWGHGEHALCLLDTRTGAMEATTLPHTAEDIAKWAAGLATRFAGQPVAVCLEQSRGAVVHALMSYPWLALYPLNPKSLSSYRESLKSSGSKSDAGDAQLLCEYFAKHWDNLKPWQPDTVAVRQLALLVEDRRQTVELQVQAIQRLQITLKAYFPQALILAGDDLGSALATDFLTRWPSLRHLQKTHKAQPHYLKQFYRRHNCRSENKLQARLELAAQAKPLTTDEAVIGASQLKVGMLVGQLNSLRESLALYDREIRQLFEQQEDAHLFKGLPGAGAQLAPRLLAAFGTDRQRWDSPQQLQAYSGVAPVTKKSGKSCLIHQRYACPKFLRQSFHEFAQCSIRFSKWARAFYAEQRKRGKSHHTAVRALAYKWLRIIWRCWQERVPYDELRYLEALERRNSPLFQNLVQTSICTSKT